MTLKFFTLCAIIFSFFLIIFNTLLPIFQISTLNKYAQNDTLIQQNIEITDSIANKPIEINEIKNTNIQSPQIMDEKVQINDNPPPPSETEIPITPPNTEVITLEPAAEKDSITLAAEQKFQKTKIASKSKKNK